MRIKKIWMVERLEKIYPEAFEVKEVVSQG